MKKILLAANPNADQPWVADATAELARETGASVVVVSVDDIETEKFAPLPREEYVKRADQAATAALERLEAAGVSASKHVLSGAALDAILDFAEEERPDLIVLGPSTRTALTQRLFGSVHLGLLQRSTRPVLVVTAPRAAA